jgi:hypothetical protein
MFAHTASQSCRTVCVLITLMAAGCQAQPDRSDILAPSPQVQSLKTLIDHADQRIRPGSDPILVHKDVQAILDGMSRAKSFRQLVRAADGPQLRH